MKTRVIDFRAGPTLDAAVTRELGSSIGDGNPSIDMAAAREMETRLPANLRERYVKMLITVCNLDVDLFDSALERGGPDIDVPDALWTLIHAGALQRTRAFLLTCGIEFIET